MIYLDTRSGRWIVEIDRRVKAEEGVRRLRKRKMLPKGTTQEQAQAVAQRMESAEVTRALAVESAAGWDAYVARLEGDPSSWLHKTMQKAHNRAKAGAYPFRLTARGLAEHMLRTKGRCEVTGLRFTTEACVARRKRPFFHSIDRIEAAVGYTPSNIRIVCFAVNMAMSNWGEDTFGELARGFVFNRYAAFNVQRELGENFPVRDSA